MYLFDEREQVRDRALSALTANGALDNEPGVDVAVTFPRWCRCYLQLLRLQAENDSLKIQEIEDRRRIQHLLALTQPVTQEVTFFRDCRPEKMTRYPGASMASSAAPPSTSSAAGHQKQTVSTSTPQVRRCGRHGDGSVAVT